MRTKYALERSEVKAKSTAGTVAATCRKSLCRLPAPGCMVRMESDLGPVAIRTGYEPGLRSAEFRFDALKIRDRVESEFGASANGKRTCMKNNSTGILVASTATGAFV